MVKFDSLLDNDEGFKTFIGDVFELEEAKDLPPDQKRKLLSQWEESQGKGQSGSDEGLIGPFNLLSFHDAFTATTINPVRDLSALRSNVAATLRVTENSIALFGGRLNPLTRNIDYTRLTESNQLRDLKVEGESTEPICLRYTRVSSVSPQSSPLVALEIILPQTVANNGLFSIPDSFAEEIPRLLEDMTYRSSMELLSKKGADNKSVVLMSVPGAGKTRTVREAAKGISACYVRFKFLLLHPFVEKLKRIADSKKKSMPEAYDDRKRMFAPCCQEFLNVAFNDENLYRNDQYEPADVFNFRVNQRSGLIVVHFDEVQVLMGKKVVSKFKKSDDPFDYAMPTFGDAIHSITSTRANLKVALTGTNFFAPLTFNSGSELKIEQFPMQGGFPIDWGLNLMKDFFKFESMEDKDLKRIIAPMCANRRAFQKVAWALEMRVGGLQKQVDERILQVASEKAYSVWSGEITRSMGANRNGALALLALLSYPKNYGAEEKDVGDDGNYLLVPIAKLPEAVKEYALGGAVNVAPDGATNYRVSIPAGCTMRLLSSLCKSTAGDNMKEFEVFRVASKSVGTDKGHFFERMTACELSFVQSKLFETLLSSTGWDVQPDQRIFAKRFVYEAKIHEADWSMGQVFCVLEDFKANGRVVDVGFPTIIENRYWKVYCELKVVQDQNKLWVLCASFFEKMVELGVGNEKNATIAVFLSYHEFLSHQPIQKEVKKSGNKSAHDSRIYVKELLKNSRQYFAVVDQTNLQQADTVLPMVDLYRLIDQENAVEDVTEISDELGGMYTSSSQPVQPAGLHETVTKKPRIDQNIYAA